MTTNHYTITPSAHRPDKPQKLDFTDKTPKRHSSKF